MARIRTIKPEFWQDEKLTPLPDCARLVFLGLISMADDCGRVLYNPKLIEAHLFDAETDRSRDIREALATLSRIARVVVGRTASGQRVLQIANWERHQKVDKPNLRGALPEIVEHEALTPIRDTFANDSRGIREALATHTNDLRPTTNDLRPPLPADRLRDTPEPVADDLNLEPMPKKRAPRPKPIAPVKWPDWSQAERTRLYEMWRTELGSVGFPQWIASLGDMFGRPPEGFAYADVVAGYRGWLKSVGFGGNGTRFASPAACAKALAACAKVARDVQDPAARDDAYDLIAHGRVAA